MSGAAFPSARRLAVVSTGCQHGPALGPGRRGALPSHRRLSLWLHPPLEKLGWLHNQSKVLAEVQFGDDGIAWRRRERWVSWEGAVLLEMLFPFPSRTTGRSGRSVERALVVPVLSN